MYSSAKKILRFYKLLTCCQTIILQEIWILFIISPHGNSDGDRVFYLAPQMFVKWNYSSSNCLAFLFLFSIYFRSKTVGNGSDLRATLLEHFPIFTGSCGVLLFLYSLLLTKVGCCVFLFPDPSWWFISHQNPVALHMTNSNLENDLKKIQAKNIRINSWVLSWMDCWTVKLKLKYLLFIPIITKN